MELEETVEEILPTSVQNNNNISDLVSPVGHRHLSESSLSFTDKNKGWKLVQRRIPDILEYGRKEGILVQKIETQEDIQKKKEIEIAKAKKLNEDESVNTEFSFIRSAIPCLPVPAATLCCVLNFLLPGSGTLLSGFCCICMGQTRIHVKEGKVVWSLIVNTLVAVCQLGTITFFFVGWFWSMAWGGLMLMHSIQHRDSKKRKRQIAVATAAIEALTKNALLRRRKVKNLVEAQHNSTKHEQNSSILHSIMKSINSQEQILTDSAGNTSEINMIVQKDEDQPPVLQEETKSSNDAIKSEENLKTDDHAVIFE